MVRLLATALIGLFCSSAVASIIVTPGITYTHNATNSVAHVKFYAGGDTASRAVSNFQFDFSTAGLTGLASTAFVPVDGSSFWRSAQFSVTNTTPTNVLRITGAQGTSLFSNAPVSGTVAVNEIAAFDLTFNRPAAGTADLLFTRTGLNNDFSGLFQQNDGTGQAVLPNPALTPSYPTDLTINIPQQAGGGGGGGGAAVPEPGSVLAVSVVLGGLGIRALRRRRQTETT
jgi:hypothetical protein